jgi:hypothetical protein
MKQKPEVLEHGWTRRNGPKITAANLTDAQAKEQVDALSRQWDIDATANRGPHFFDRNVR